MLTALFYRYISEDLERFVNSWEAEQGDEGFDVIVSNPPYSMKWTGPDSPTTINDQRFAPAGVLAPKSRADFAFLMHMLAWLSDTGTAAVVVFPGILYRGGAEGKIRKYMVDHNFVDAVIQLPTNLFFGTTIQTCVMVLRKNKPDTDILFINAERGFGHEGNKNKLREEDTSEHLMRNTLHKEVCMLIRLFCERHTRCREFEGDRYTRCRELA